LPDESTASDDYLERLDLSSIQDTIEFMIKMNQVLGSKSDPVSIVTRDLEMFCESYSILLGAEQQSRLVFVEESLESIQRKFWDIHNEIVG